MYSFHRTTCKRPHTETIWRRLFLIPTTSITFSRNGFNWFCDSWPPENISYHLFSYWQLQCATRAAQSKVYHEKLAELLFCCLNVLHRSLYKENRKHLETLIYLCPSCQGHQIRPLEKVYRTFCKFSWQRRHPWYSGVLSPMLRSY